MFDFIGWRFTRTLQSLTVRSGRWPTVRSKFLAGKRCSACDDSAKLEAHHIVPFYVDSALELEESNLIALCRDCHWFIGHLQHWDKFNPRVVEDSAHFLKRVKEFT
jgi:hypothetical protein